MNSSARINMICAKHPGMKSGAFCIRASYFMLFFFCMIHFIVNPVSKSGKGLKLWKNRIEPVLRAKDIGYSLDFSKEHGDVTSICSRLSRNASKEKNCTVVILGGDGTLNDAVQGIEDFENTVLAYIPAGSSNDFARDMHLSKSVKKSLERILSGQEPKLLDIGEVTTEKTKRRFAVSCGIGFDAAVCQRASHSYVKKTLNKFGLGKLTYLAIALRQLLNAPESDCQIEFSSGEKLLLKKFLFAASMVHSYEGGGFKFCPKASCTDGKMNLCAVNGKSVPGILLALPTAFFGLHGLFKGIHLLEFDSATITSDVPLWLHTDGEVWQKSSQITVRTFEKKLKIIV